MTAVGGHISAAEIADLALPGLPRSKRGVLLRAEAERWTWIEHRRRGGTVRLFAVEGLPEPAREALQQRRLQLVPANLRPVGRPKGSDYFTRYPEAADAVEVILSRQQLAAQRVLELLSQSFPVLPSRRTLARYIARFEAEKKPLLTSFRDPDAYKSKHRVALGRKDAAVTRANQVWEIDTTKADVLTKGGRKSILGLVDVYSRRASYLVCPSESAQSVRRLLVETIRAWGVVPEVLRTDNGSGYVNASVVSALPALGIRHDRVPPGSGDAKPFVERLFGTFTRERAELLDGYCGHNVADAQAIRQRARKETGRAVIVPELEPEQLQDIINAWLDGVYHQRPHSTTRQAPIARWLASPAPSARAPSEDALKIALSALIGSATVGKRGIQWRRGRYWSPALCAWIGRTVELRRDEDDLGAIFVFDEDGHFIDTAVNHERAGMSEEQFARAARQQQNDFMAKARAELRAKKSRFSVEDARDALLREDALRAGQLALFPVQTVERPTRQLQSIAATPAPKLPSQAALDEAMTRTAPPRQKELSIAEKVAAADRVLAAVEAGADVDADAIARARLYASSTEYRAQKLLTVPFPGPQGLTPPLTRRQSA